MKRKRLLWLTGVDILVAVDLMVCHDVSMWQKKKKKKKTHLMDGGKEKKGGVRAPQDP